MADLPSKNKRKVYLQTQHKENWAQHVFVAKRKKLLKVNLYRSNYNIPIER